MAFPLGAALAGDPYSAYARSYQTATDQAGQEAAGKFLQQMFNAPMPGAQPTMMPPQAQAQPMQQGAGFLQRLFGGGQQPQAQAPMAGPMGGSMPPGGPPGRPMTPPPSPAGMRPPPAPPSQMLPQGGGGQNPISAMSFPQIVQGLVRSNPGASPPQIFSALRQMAPAITPFMNAEALAQYRNAQNALGWERDATARRGQDIREQTTERGQDIRAQTAGASLEERTFRDDYTAWQSRNKARVDSGGDALDPTDPPPQRQRPPSAAAAPKAQGQTWTPKPRPGYGPGPPPPAGPSPAVQPGVQPGAQPGATPAVQPGVQPGPPPAVQPGAQPEPQAATGVVPQTTAPPPGISTLQPPQAGAGALGQALAQRAAQGGLPGGLRPQPAPGAPQAPAAVPQAPPTAPQAAAPAPVQTASAAPLAFSTDRGSSETRQSNNIINQLGKAQTYQSNSLAWKANPELIRSIAEYRQAPLSQNKPANKAIMREVEKYSNDVLHELYDATAFNTRKGVESHFASGVESRRLTAINAVVGHFEVLNDAAKVLEETMRGKQLGVSGMPGAGVIADIPALRRISSVIAKEFGFKGPIAFEAVRDIVADEVVKAIVINGGGVTDRQEIRNRISVAQSPQQLQEVIGRYKEMMAGQAMALKQQYTGSGGRRDFDKELLTEPTRKALSITVPRKAEQPAPSYGGPQE